MTRRPKAAPTARTPRKESKAEQDRRIAIRTFVWTKRAAVLTAVGVVVAIAAIVIPIVLTQQGSSAPPGIAVNVVPQDPINGATIYPQPGSGEPSAYLRSGWSFYVDCLQEVRPKYLFARISSGPYTRQWVYVQDIRRRKAATSGP